jgi:copper chaperone CopZ
MMRNLFAYHGSRVRHDAGEAAINDRRWMMSSKTITVPAIHCGHCTHTIELELGELPGVRLVKADQESRRVTVEWEPPATWEQIEATLREINYPPADLLQFA